MNTKFTQFLCLLVGLMVLSASALYAQPANNECSGAVDISALFDGVNDNASSIFDNSLATSEASDPTTGFECFGETPPTLNNTLWVTFVGDGNGYTITTNDCGSANYITNADAQIATYTGSCDAFVSVTGGCSEDGAGATAPSDFYAEVVFQTTVGTTYYMMLDGFNGVAGEFCLLVSPTTIVTACDPGTMTTTGEVTVSGTTETFDLAVEDVVVPTGGVQRWLFLPGPNGGGGQFNGGAFATVTMGMETFNSALNTMNPVLTGTWTIYSYITGSSDINDECGRSTEFLTVNFDTAEPQPECDAGVMTTVGEIDVVGTVETFDVAVDSFLIPNTPTTGRLWWLFVPGDNATGGPFEGGAWGRPTGGTDTFTSTINGTNPAMTGTWQIFSYVTASADINDECSTSETSLTVNFDILDSGPCDAGSLVAMDIQTACVGDSVNVAIIMGTDTIPNGGNRGWFFDPTNTGGTGGFPNGTIATGSPAVASYTNDLNGVLTGAPPLEGLYAIKSFMYTIPSNPGGSVCSISSDSILVVFGDVVDLEIIENNGQLSAFVGPDFMDYTYAWSSGETEITITPATPGEYMVTATDGLGCETIATFNFMPVSTNEADIVNNLSVAPNPTAGLINVALDLPASKEVQLSVIDITGKEVINLAPVTFTSRNFEVDLQNQASGLYLLRFRIGNEVVTRRVVKK